MTATTKATTSGTSSASATSRDSWWNTDISIQEPKTGSVSLVERCRRLYGWTPSFALEVLRGYKLFLESKQFMHDWDATKLSPSILIDRMWHAHILDTRNYTKDCMTLFGNVIHHDPDGMMANSEEKKRRIEAMRDLAKARLGNSYSESSVWDFGIEESDVDGEPNPKRPRIVESEPGSSPGSLARKSDTDGDRSTQEENDGDGGDDVHNEPIIICLRDLYGGEVTYFKVKKTIPMSRVFETYAQRLHADASTFRFMLDGNRIEPDQTLELLEFDDEEQIDVVLEQGGC